MFIRITNSQYGGEKMRNLIFKNLNPLKLVIVLSIFAFICINCGGGGDSGSGGGNSSSQGTTPSPSGSVSVLRITEVNPDSALSGSNVQINFESDGSSTPIVVMSGVELPTTQLNSNTISFTVPSGANSGPTYLKDGVVSSPPVWFSIAVSAVEPDPTKTITTSDGKEVSSSIITISMNEGFDSKTEAQRVANLISGTIVGQVPVISGYQIEVNISSETQLKNYVAILEADPAVDFALPEIQIESDLDWADKGYPGQRDSNRVVEGANLYNANVSSADTSLIRPIFTAIGVVESGVDFDAHDFDGYAEKGTARSNNIGIYSKDVSGSKTDEEHGTTVTGVIAAEHGDGAEDLGKNAGLLQALTNHGGFNIRVDGSGSIGGKTWASSCLKKTEDMLADGARVINWSFGIHKKGAIQADGTAVNNNDFGEFYFNRAHKAFAKGLVKLATDYPESIIVSTAGNGNTLTDDVQFVHLPPLFRQLC